MAHFLHFIEKEESILSKKIAILHYASPPIIGGVEATLAHHARELANLGYQVRVLSGDGGSFDSRIETRIHPLFGSRDERVLTIKKELDKGVISDGFHQLVKEQQVLLEQNLEDCDACIVHNIHALNKNLALTAALSNLANPRLIAWVHDMAWTNPQYLPELHSGYPWNLLREKWITSRYVTVSDARRKELANLLDIIPDKIAVVTAGVDIADLLHWTDDMRMIEDKLHLLDAEMLFLLPARVTRRKNIELALRVLHELKQKTKQDYRLIITGPPGPHNPNNTSYLDELLTLRKQLDLQSSVHFLYELNLVHFIPDNPTMANLYQIADALLFPSFDEGLGIPILEAGLIGMPIFCSNLAPFYQTGQDNLNYFEPKTDSPEKIAQMIHDYFAKNSRQKLKTRIRQEYRWDSIIKTQLVPLLEET